MKAGWAIKPLGEVCKFQRGLTYAKTDEVDTSGNIVLRATNIDLATNLLDLTELKYINDSVVVDEGKKVKRGSLLICTASGSKSHLGKVAYIDDDYDFAFGGFMGILTPNEGVLPRYLFHLMTSGAYKDFITALSDGTNINNLKFFDLQQFPVPVAPIPEQRRIVGILDEAFEGIATAKANAEKNLENARAVFKSELNAIFTNKGSGWKESRIVEELILQRGFDITKSQQFDGMVPVVSSGGIKSYHSEAIVSAPGVVIGRKGTLGKVFYLDKDFWPHDTTLWVKDFKGNNPKLIYYFFLGLDVKKFDSGAANPALNRNNLHPLLVNWPPISQQASIVSTLDSLGAETERLESIYKRKLSALDALKKSLLHEAFTGNL